MNNQTTVLPPAEPGAVTSGETEAVSATEASTAKAASKSKPPASKPKAKRSRTKRKPAAKRTAASKSSTATKTELGVEPGETPAFHVLTAMSREADAELNKDANGNPLDRRDRRRTYETRQRRRRIKP